MTGHAPIFVTQPSVPQISELLPLLTEIWERRYLTNNGPILQRLEAALCEHLGLAHITLVANATLGLFIALRGLRPGTEVITTPFSFVASAHAITWAGAKPVFADIDPITLNLDLDSVARAITPRTGAILAVHCFGNPCDVGGLERIAKQHGLRLIFDAAHAFGVRRNGRSILSRGDLSVVSFHATKVFSTVEGGAIISRDRKTKLELDRACNFGIVDEATIPTVGLNAKMSELHAAFGLALLPHIPALIEGRRQVAERYLEAFRGVSSIRCICSQDPGHNYYAFPILVSARSRRSRDALHTLLKEHNIFARRYFYPLLSDLPPYRQTSTETRPLLPVARDIANRVLCLPIYPHLEPSAQDRIIAIIRGAVAN